MSRNGSGTYTLPAGNPVSSGTLIDAAWANSTLSDIASALTDSLSRSGSGGMTAPLRFTDGSVSAPGFAWTNETSSGFYRAGASDFRVALNGVDVATVTSTGLTVVSGKTLAAQGNATVAGTLGVTGVLTATGGVSGNATTATTLQTARNINGVSFNGSANIDVNTVNAITFNNGGAGDASGTTFNGGAARTISYNTVGAPSTTGTNATGSWNINAATVTNGVYTTGDQNIAGSKRFSSSVVVGATGTAASTFDVQTTGANVLTSLFTTGLTDLNFRIGAMNGVAGGTTGTTQGKLGLFYLGTGEAATIDFRRGSTSTDASFAFRTSGIDRATLDNSGNFISTGNITATGGTVTLGSSALAPTGSAPSYTARAWVNFNGTGTVAIRASGNVTSITDNGTGDYTVNFTTAMSDANYSAVVTTNGGSTDNGTGAVNTYATTTARLFTVNSSNNTARDTAIVNVAIFR